MLNPETAHLLRALNHPLRRRMLIALEEQQIASPVELSQSLGEPLSNVSYHMTVLSKCKAVRLVKTRQVRGALQHFYSRSSLDEAEEWIQAALRASESSDNGRQ